MAVIVVVKSGQFTAGETEKGQFLWGNRRNEKRELWERFRLQAVYRVFLIFEMTGIMGEGKYCSVGERVCRFISGKSSV